MSGKRSIDSSLKASENHVKKQILSSIDNKSLKLSLHEDKIASYRLQMVNNPKMADVTFVVGRNENVVQIVAHAALLVVQSEMFQEMFCDESFKDAKILVTDFEPATFLELLKFMYAGPKFIQLTPANMLQMLHGAQKYRLPELGAICEEFIVGHVNESNALEVFNLSQSCEGKLLKQLSLDIVLDNPLLFFNKKNFLDLGHQALKELVDQPKLNCSPEHLQTSVLRWQRHQQDDNTMKDDVAFQYLHISAGIVKSNFLNKSYSSIKVDGFNWNFEMVPWKTNKTAFNLQHDGSVNDKFIHGIGIVSGAEISNFKDSLTIQLWVQDTEIGKWLMVTKLNVYLKQQSAPGITTFIFPKFLAKHYVMCEIDFESARPRFVMNNTVCAKQHNHYENQCTQFQMNDTVERSTSVAYLLYSDSAAT